MFKSGTVDDNLCECVEMFASIIEKKRTLLDSKIYEYIPTDKCTVKGGIIPATSECIHLNGYAFQLSDNFGKLMEEGLDIDKGINSIHEQIAKIILCNRPTKSARNPIHK